MEQLLLEDYFSDKPFEVITESSKLPKGVIMITSGPIGITEKKNLNGRVYTNNFWSSVLSRPAVVSDIKERALVGSADHPKSFMPPMKTISHVLVEAFVNKNENALYGKSEVLDLPMGKIVKSCYDSNLKVGASTRGGGMTKNKNGVDYVLEKDYRFGGFDYCFRPSAQNAYPKPVQESVEQIICESSVDDLGETEESKDFFKRILEKFGCNVKLISEKYKNVFKRYYIVPSNFQTENILYTNSIFSVVETDENDTIPECSILADSGMFDKISKTKEKILALTDKIMNITESSLPPGDINDLREELNRKQAEITSLKESGEENLESVKKFRSLYLSLEKKLSSAKSLMGDKIITFQNTVESFEDNIKALEDEKQALEELSESLEEKISDLENRLSNVNKDKNAKGYELRISRYRRKNKELLSENNKFLEELKKIRKLYYSLKSGISESDIVKEGLYELPLNDYDKISSELQPDVDRSVMNVAPKVTSFQSLESRSKKKKTSQITNMLNIMGGKK
jgi:hypothetical protein